MTRAAWIVPALSIALAACSGAPEPVAAPKPAIAAPTTAPVVTREEPPPSGPEKAFRIPKPVWGELPNGLRYATIVSKTLPIVELRVVFLVGKAADGEKPGLVATTAEMLKEGGAGPNSGRELLSRVEALGANLGVATGFDRTVLSMAVTKDNLFKAAELLGTVVQSPRFSAIEFDKLKKREIDRVADAARGSGSWAASMVLYRDLFALPTDHHPYASFDASPADAARLTSADCRAAHRKWFIPKNAFVVVAGDSSPDEVKAVVAKTFGGFSGGEVPAVSYPEPSAPEHRRITIVDRPKASQSDVYVATLGLERGDKDWTTFVATNQILGGGVGGRLFKEVREKRGLAYSASSWIVEVAHSQAPIVAHVGTQTAKTGVALEALLEESARLGKTAPDDAEVAAARRYLAGILAVRLETIGAVADELVRLKSLGLPDDYDDTFRRELGDVTSPLVTKLAGELREEHEIVVVAGDAEVIGPLLRHFGEVKVLDPTREFARVRTIPVDASAPIELPASNGK